MVSTAEVLVADPETSSEAQGTLRRGAVSFAGLVAQSVAGVAPSTSIALPVVVVAGVCGKGAWLTWTKRASMSR